MARLDTPGWKTLKDETGNRHNRLTVVRYAYTAEGGHAMFDCVCDCGNSTTVAGVDLRSGHTRSCGCLHQEIAAKNMRAVQPSAAAAKKGKRK